MSKKKKRTNSTHKPVAAYNTSEKRIRLSQCIIVKNEEKNIKKALSWAKVHAYEQIVVDTGSTDRTVEIAKSMGAKVFHFEWVDDFAMAKNYAIEQAKGDWIAFLDADEYFSDADAKKLMRLLEKIETDPRMQNEHIVIVCKWIQIDDDGYPFMVSNQQRVFHNTPNIRYEGRIHEVLQGSFEGYGAFELSIIHTGYSKSAFHDTGKAERNIVLLRDEIERKPEDMNLKCYLAEALYATGDVKLRTEALTIYQEAISSKHQMIPSLKQRAYSFCIVIDFEDIEKDDEIFRVCKAAYEEFPQNPDFCNYYGRRLFKRNDYIKAWEKYVECENLLMRKNIDTAGYIISNHALLFYQMVLTAQALGNAAEVIRCATLVLREDKYHQGVLTHYIQAFNESGYQTSSDDIFAILSKLYDFSNAKDRLAVMSAAKSACNMELFTKVLTTFTADELSWLTESPDK